MLLFLRQFLLWIMALSILNTSIDVIEWDTPFFTLDGNREGMAQYDDIESIVEWVMSETSDDHSSTVPDTNSEQQKLLKKASNFDFSLPVRKVQLLSDLLIAGTMRPTLLSTCHHLPAGFTALFTPPPDLA